VIRRRSGSVSYRRWDMTGEVPKRAAARPDRRPRRVPGPAVGAVADRGGRCLPSLSGCCVSMRCWSSLVRPAASASSSARCCVGTGGSGLAQVASAVTGPGDTVRLLTILIVLARSCPSPHRGWLLVALPTVAAPLGWLTSWGLTQAIGRARPPVAWAGPAHGDAFASRSRGHVEGRPARPRCPGRDTSRLASLAGRDPHAGRRDPVPGGTLTGRARRAPADRRDQRLAPCLAIACLGLRGGGGLAVAP
jgi:hypothetical protein